MPPNTTPSVASMPGLDPGLYSFGTTLIWAVLAILLVVLFKKHLLDIVASLAFRIKIGGAFKLWKVEFGPIRVSANARPKKGEIHARRDEAKEKEREEVYAYNRQLFLVHRLFPSTVPGQLYDVLIYLLWHKEGNIIERVFLAHT